MINKAELGDFLYIIVFAILMIVGLLEKVAKAKKQTQPPPTPHPHDDFEDVEEQQSQADTLEEVMKRMLQTMDPSEDDSYRAEKIQPSMVVSETPVNYYKPIECDTWGKLEKKQFPQAQNVMEVEEVDKEFEFEFGFDIRQAVIASEILNKKY